MSDHKSLVGIVDRGQKANVFLYHKLMGQVISSTYETEDEIVGKFLGSKDDLISYVGTNDLGEEVRHWFRKTLANDSPELWLGIATVNASQRKVEGVEAQVGSSIRQM